MKDCMCMRPFRRFRRDQSGAVTVDWVVLAGAVVGIGLASAAAVRTGVVDLGADIDTSLSGASVADLSTLGTGGAYEHTLLQASQEMFDTWMRQFSTWENAELRLSGLYSYLSSTASLYLDSGNIAGAGIYIDLMAAVQQSLDALGSARPDGTPAVSDLVNRYHEVFG